MWQANTIFSILSLLLGLNCIEGIYALLHDNHGHHELLQSVSCVSPILATIWWQERTLAREISVKLWIMKSRHTKCTKRCLVMNTIKPRKVRNFWGISLSKPSVYREPYVECSHQVSALTSWLSVYHWFCRWMRFTRKGAKPLFHLCKLCLQALAALWSW